MPLDWDAVNAFLATQDGVISRRQVRASGGSDNDVERLVRRREWARVHTGVYVHHTGPLTWKQRCWAALLAHWPATLNGESALVAHRLRGEPSGSTPAVEVAIAANRCVDPVPGVQVMRITDFEVANLAALSPPRVRLEHAVLTVAARARDEDDAVAVLAQAVQKRHTTAQRLKDALDKRRRLPHRRLLLTILEDVASGAYSAMERRYLQHVERPHGLPTGARQRRVKPGRTIAYRDVEYLDRRTVVELDGRLGHEGVLDRWKDFDRDIDGLVSGDVTLRAGWAQVLHPCRLAAAISAVLVARGWDRSPHPCGPACAISAGSQAPGAGDPSASAGQ
jgi:hypothetical protein